MDFKEVHGWVLCSHKNIFYISLRNQGPRVQCEVSTVSAGLGSSIICCCWRLLSRSMQTSTKICRPLRASFWPALWRCWFYFPAELAHTDNDTNTWFMDHGIPEQNCLANGVLWRVGCAKVQKCRRAEGLNYCCSNSCQTGPTQYAVYIFIFFFHSPTFLSFLFFFLS